MTLLCFFNSMEQNFYTTFDSLYLTDTIYAVAPLRQIKLIQNIRASLDEIQRQRCMSDA